ncbi:signal transduction histidine kinase [Kribbella sp. VKM Ac-2571]|uniref:sensor histidine kinase n=1 Tax=Kribbella sp. VKM Ac-2571 TaxID=2512222 RepID=UPI0010EA7FDC|nr:histidine kinase [Kribbella sp. VKM Ac-2571]TDO45178.1 signal transduction histidine kinase [Kribbella sp. VKM Ac-2571]
MSEEYGLSRRQLIVADCVVAAGYAVLVLLTSSTGPGLVAIGLGLPIAVRRIWPVPALTVVAVMSMGAFVVDALRDPLLAAAYVLYVVALTRSSNRPLSSRRLIAVAGAVGFVVLFLAMAAGAPAGQSRAALVLTGVAALYGAWVLGQVVRDRRAAAARAAQVLAEQAVAAERLRIARELHDIVAHSMGLIAVKAGVANHVLRVRPEEVSDALSVIESTSRDALVELRHMLGLLRPSGEPVELAPPAGLAALPDLVSRVESTGVQVELKVAVPEPLPEAVDLTLHRIVQECLTNVTKHARAARCQITITGAANAVQLEVSDDGAGGAVVEGHGLIGIRERVSVYGGSYRAGPRAGGGFEVVVRLPYE